MRLIQIDPFSSEGNNPQRISPPSSFLQMPFWAEFKAVQGWDPLYFLISEFDPNVADAKSDSSFLSILVRPLTPIASIAYVPLGPDLLLDNPDRQGELLSEFALAIAPYLPTNTVCVRFDPPWGTIVPNSYGDVSEAIDGQGARGMFPEKPSYPARKAPVTIQPPDTVVLDLTQSRENLFAQMKPKWRYNVKLGDKRGVAIRCLDGVAGATEGVDIFYRLYLETARRDGIAIHAKSYYADLISGAARRKSPYDATVSVRVYIAEHEGIPLASIITLFAGSEAVYLYGASSNEKRNLMPAYSLQWRAICDAQAAGCSRYDFYGIPPTNAPEHPMHGLYRFKTGFGGSIIHRVGSFDIPLRPVRYHAYRFLETARNFWFKKVVKFFRREIPRTS